MKNGQLQDRFRGTMAKNYRPQVVGYGVYPFDDDYPFLTYADIEKMRRDNQVDFALRVLAAPIHTAKWEVKCQYPNVAKFVDRQLKKIWQKDICRVLPDLFAYGTIGGEVNYREHKGKFAISGLQDFHIADMRPLEKDGRWCGLSVTGVRTEKGKGKIYLMPPKAWWITLEARYGAYFGRGRLRPAWYAYQEKRGDKGAVESRRTWYGKNAFDGGVMRHPEGDVQDENGNIIPCQEYARRILELKETGGVMILPNSKEGDSTDYQWTYEAPKVNGELRDLRDYPKDLDNEILRGSGVPPEVVEASETGSGYAGRAIPAMVFFTSEDSVVDTVIRSIKEQVLDWLVYVNFGQVLYEIVPTSLVPQPEEGQQGQASPGAMAQQQGGTPQPQEQPAGVQMSLSEPLQRVIDAVQALLPPTVRLSLDEQGHEHKGKGEGGGQFVKKSDGESGDKSETKSKGKSKILAVAKLALKAANAMPEVAKMAMKEAGFSDRVARWSYIAATIGDYAVPMVPAGSAMVLIVATVRKPSLPIKAVKGIINKVKQRFKKPDTVTMALDAQVPVMVAIGKALEAAQDERWFMTVFAVEMEESGDAGKALEVTQTVMEEYPTPPGETTNLSLVADRSERESVNTEVDEIIDRGASAGIAVSDEVRERVRELVKKKYPRMNS